jgi:hypothetical protein
MKCKYGVDNVLWPWVSCDTYVLLIGAKTMAVSAFLPTLSPFDIEQAVHVSRSFFSQSKSGLIVASLEVDPTGIRATDHPGVF